MRDKDYRLAFTLIEIMIVIAISAMLSAIAIGYSSVGRNEVSLSIETTKVSQVILQAQGLSVSTYGNAQGDCAYGVLFNMASETYSIFGYNPPRPKNTTCPSLASVIAAGLTPSSTVMYTQGTWNIHLANGVVLSPGPTGSDNLSAVLFYPPDPQTLLSHDGRTFFDPAFAPTLKVYLKTVDGAAAQAISVSPSGQVDF